MIPAISNYSVKLLSGLANNNDSLVPMVVKDFAGNCAVVATYSKVGTKDDVRERAIEDFGTGAIWLFAIPIIKKLFDKTVYPLFKLNSDFDIRLLKGKSDSDIENMAKNVMNAAKNNDALKSEASCYADMVKNKNLYKGLFVSKFITSTVLSMAALYKLIKYKQKTTHEKVKKDYYNKNTSLIMTNNKINNSENYGAFTGKKKKNSNISFGNFLSSFMYNPKMNTSILDGAIATIRLKEGRKGERKEIALREFFQMAAIYVLANPIQYMFEKAGDKMGIPIKLDPEVLFAKNLKRKVNAAMKTIEGNNLKESENIVADIYKIAEKNVNNPLIDILAKNHNISLVKHNGEAQAISYLKHVDEASLKKTLSNIETLHSALKNSSSLTSIKCYKAFSAIANTLIGIFALGVVLPKLTIGLRKMFNDGDNRNPAIVQQEKELKENLAI